MMLLCSCGGGGLGITASTPLEVRRNVDGRLARGLLVHDDRNLHGLMRYLAESRIIVQPWQVGDSLSVVGSLRVAKHMRDKTVTSRSYYMSQYVGGTDQPVRDVYIVTI